MFRSIVMNYRRPLMIMLAIVVVGFLAGLISSGVGGSVGAETKKLDYRPGVLPELHNLDAWVEALGQNDHWGDVSLVGRRQLGLEEELLSLMVLTGTEKIGGENGALLYISNLNSPRRADLLAALLMVPNSVGLLRIVNGDQLSENITVEAISLTSVELSLGGETHRKHLFSFVE